LKLLQGAADRGEDAIRQLPEHANGHYTLALVLGRYSQRTSIVTALAEGTGGRIRVLLERTLALEPRHAEAHVAFGLYHAEIVGQLGGLVGGLTYGVSTKGALEHFRAALKLAPESPIVHVELAHGLMLIDARANRAQALEHYERAAACVPADAMERLDVERARRGLA
jgi:tetratricopeptide (TPR) repeat protein